MPTTKTGLRMIDPRRLTESYGGGRGSRLKSEGGGLDDATVKRYADRLRRARAADRLNEALRSLGFPLFVWLFPDGEIQIGDGHHRVQAAIRAGLKRIPVTIEEEGA